MNTTDHTDDTLPTLAEFLTAHGWQPAGDGRRWVKGGREMTGSLAMYAEYAVMAAESAQVERERADEG